MKNVKTAKKVIAVILTITSLIFPSACSKKTNDAQNTSIGTSGANIQNDAYEAKISYCLQQIASLEAQLTEKKEEMYVNESKYALEIAALKATVSSLKSQLGDKTDADASDAPAAENTDQKKTGDFTYKKENGGVTITKYNGSSAEVIIPDKIDGESVLCIGEGSFEASTASKIVIPEGVKKIDWFAFRACTQLTEINIPASVTKIEYGAFESAKSAFVIICPKGSFVETYAKSWGYICVSK